MPGPLDGVRVLEFSQIIAAPFGGMLLADMGAEVIKVEPLEGEPWRLYQQFVPLESRPFISLNRGKRSLPLDLSRPEAREIVYKLIPSIDVVVINYRPDVPYKLGIDYETLLAINPRLIYCENTAYGRRGPEAQRPGYDIIIQAMSGLMAETGKIEKGVPREISGVEMADFSAGFSIAWGVCAALFAREKTGEGQKIETSLLASALAIQTQRFTFVEDQDGEMRRRSIEELDLLRTEGATYAETYALLKGQHPKPGEDVYYRTYQTMDSAIAVACLSDRLRKKMLDALRLHDIRFEPGYDPRSERAEDFRQRLVQQAEEVFRSQRTEEWVRLLDAVGVPCGPVKFIEELIREEQVLANDLVIEVQHPKAGRVKTVGPALQMSGTPLKVRSSSPPLGHDTDTILRGLGYDGAAIQRLKDGDITR